MCRVPMYACVCACVGRVRAWSLSSLSSFSLSPFNITRRGREGERERERERERTRQRQNTSLFSFSLSLLSSPFRTFTSSIRNCARLGNRNCNTVLHYLRETAYKCKNESDETVLCVQIVIWNVITILDFDAPMYDNDLYFFFLFFSFSRQRKCEMRHDSFVLFRFLRY